MQAQQPNSTISQSQIQETPKANKPFPEHEINFLYGESSTLGILSILDRPDKSIGRFSFSYFYRLSNKWLSVGATSTYIPYSVTHSNTTYNVSETGSYYKTETATSHCYIFSFAAELRFYLLSKSWVDLYSGFSLGYMANYSTNNITEENLTHIKHLLYWQATAIGVSFGKNIVFGAECGFGRKGLANLYIGYKF